MSRPKKRKKHVEKAPPDGGSASGLFRDSIRRHADPFDDDGFMLGGLFDLIAMEDKPTKDALSQQGGWLVSLIRNLEIGDCERLFATILKAKENLDLPRSRQSQILRACANFIRDAGRTPTKAELTIYASQQPEHFPDLPAKEDSKGWSRLREQVGLDSLD